VTYSGTTTHTYRTPICNPSNPGGASLTSPATPATLTFRRDGTEAKLSMVTQNPWNFDLRFILVTGTLRGSTPLGSQPYALNANIDANGHLTGSVISTDEPLGCHLYELDMRQQ
jgi:hypothetical protein